MDPTEVVRANDGFCTGTGVMRPRTAQNVGNYVQEVKLKGNRRNNWLVGQVRLVSQLVTLFV